MKRILVLLILLLVANSSFATDWYSIDDKISVDLDRVKIKKHYLYLKLKYEDVTFINNILKEDSPGVLLDPGIVDYMTSDLIVDCKNPRYKVPLTMLYSKDNRIINKIKDNTWENDLSRTEWGVYCDIYDKIKE